MDIIPRQLRVYATASGKTPFDEWLDSTDKMAKRIIEARTRRLSGGLFSNTKWVGEGVFELKIDYGPGYRVYFGQHSDSIIVLLCGGDKSSQEKDIRKAQEFWGDYMGRMLS